MCKICMKYSDLQSHNISTQCAWFIKNRHQRTNAHKQLINLRVNSMDLDEWHYQLGSSFLNSVHWNRGEETPLSLSLNEVFKFLWLVLQ